MRLGYDWVCWVSTNIVEGLIIVVSVSVEGISVFAECESPKKNLPNDEIVEDIVS